MTSHNFKIVESVIQIPGNPDWAIDWKHRTFRYRDQMCLAGPAELCILECLLNNPGVLMTNTHILDCIDSPAKMKIVDVYMCRIRANIEKVNKGYIQPIKNVWGRGWYISNDKYPDIPSIPILPPEIDHNFCSRWTPQLKAFVKCSLRNGVIDRDRLMKDNIMSEREFNEWFVN